LPFNVINDSIVEVPAREKGLEVCGKTDDIQFIKLERTGNFDCLWA